MTILMLRKLLYEIHNPRLFFNDQTRENKTEYFTNNFFKKNKKMLDLYYTYIYYTLVDLRDDCYRRQKKTEAEQPVPRLR